MNERELALALSASAEKRRADPLADYYFPSPVHREVAEWVGRGVRVHHRAANLAAKTGNAAAIVTAVLRDLGQLGVGTLVGGAPTPSRERHAPVRLPKFGRPTRCAVLVQSYDGQVDSSQKWILDHLGSRPYVPAYVNKGRGVIGTLWVRPDNHRSDDPQSWSRLTFFSQETATEASVKGQRWDLVWMDEPGRREFWDECLKNARYHLLTETPIHESEWAWIAEEFRGAIGSPDRGMVELVSTLWDNGYLTAETLRQQEEKYAGKPEYRARMYGEYVNLDGQCPFDGPRLEQLLRWADPGEPWVEDRRLETWRDRKAHGQYMVLLDPSAGIAPTVDDPIGGDRCSCLAVEFLPDGKLADVARYLGWIPPHLLARMGRKLATHLNDALLVPEVNGIGEAMLPELDGYLNLFREFALEHDEKALSHRYGWYQTEGSKAALVGSLQRALLDKTYDIPSAEAVRSLMAIRYASGKEKLARRPGQNHEDMILHGMAAYIGAHPAYRPAPRWQETKPKTLTDEFLRTLGKDLGRRIVRVPEGGQVDRWQRGQR